MDRRLRLAVAANLAVHGPLVAAARHRLSYDAYVHMFFAHHYRHDWWSLWNPRWYTGFSVASYPPLAHQVIGSLSRFGSLEVAYGIVLLAVLAMIPVAIYGFARVFIERRAAGYAALLGAVLPAVAVSAHAFGQLPTLAALVSLLLALAGFNRYLEGGRARDGALVVALGAVVAATHHGTLLLVPWAGAAVVAQTVVTARVSARQCMRRVAAVLPALAAATALVIWPFWRWSLGQTMQTPIDHLSRHNFFLNPAASVPFFWAMYGPLILILPLVPLMAREKRYVVPVLLFGILFLLGLGGTTPLPRWLLGSGWVWLTYDRFALWAGVALLIFAGLLVVRLDRRFVPLLGTRRACAAGVGLFVALAVIAVMAANWSVGQPPRVDVGPIVEFLSEEDHDGWRYVTFGLGDQMAWLSILTEATTIDGSYHTARQLPELRSSGIGQIDTAVWSSPGLKALHPILEQAGERGVRWAFVNRHDHESILEAHGWVFSRSLANGVDVWLNPQAAKPHEMGSDQTGGPAAAISWGVLPLAALGMAGALGLESWWARGPALTRCRLDRVGVALGHIHRLAVGLLPLSLCLWAYRVLLQTDATNVYFLYGDAVLYLSDVVALVAVIAWGAKRLLVPADRRSGGESWFVWVFSLFPALAVCSVVWSMSPELSLFAALHFVISFGLFVSLVDDPRSWRFLAVGSSIALLTQGAAALAGFVGQSTAFLAPLGLSLPGVLGPGTPGVSVVELVDGRRWMRAYGTLPHPNMLGGWLIALGAAPVARLLRGARIHWWSLSLVGLGMVSLMLSFSRSAWLGLLAAGAVTIGHRRHLDGRRLIIVGTVVVACTLAVMIPLRELFYTRLGGLSVAAEARSLEERELLGREAASLIRTRPWLGTGIGAFVPALSAQPVQRAPLEPDHHTLRLATAELGLGVGFLALVGTAMVINQARKVRGAEAVVLSAMLLGLLVVAGFDHYLWSLGPGRTLLWLMLGAWGGQSLGEGRVGRGASIYQV